MKQLRLLFIGLLLSIMLVSILSLIGCTKSDESSFWMFRFPLPFIIPTIGGIILLAFIVIIDWLIRVSKDQPLMKNKDDKYLEIAKETLCQG